MGVVGSVISSHAAYASVRRNLTDLLRGIPGAGEFPVPACPGWSIRDLTVHLVDICRRTEARLVSGLAGRSNQVAAGVGEFGLDSLLVEWERSGGVVESALARTEHSHRGAVLVMDAFTHELDARLALGAPLPADHPAFSGAFEVAVGGLSGSIMTWGLAPLTLATEAGRWVVGEGVPAEVVRGPAMEVYRSITGRRTHRQIARMSWSADPGPWLPAFRWGPFRPPDQPVE